MKPWELSLLIGLILLFGGLHSANAAYNHGGADTDSGVFTSAHPETTGTKLDSCALCHTGGQYEQKPGKWVSLGSCQWCHYAYGYDAGGDIEQTLNPYGRDYRDAGRDEMAIKDIAILDSDGDGFSNQEEISALRYPGKSEDDPTKVNAPYRIYSREALEALPQHTQFMLMNTHKSGDFYTSYSGIAVADLLDRSGILSGATGMTVFAPDGWAQYHPLEADSDPLLYHVYGSYPEALFYYHEQADQTLNPDGWCDYTAPACANQTPGETIMVENGLKMLLAVTRDGAYLEPGELNLDNKLDGEGPFRIVPPQKMPGPPDQSSKSEVQDVIWPFNEAADHNAGFATRSATMIKIEPLPPGTTDIDILEAGWNFVDEAKIIVYGAIDPLPNISSQLNALKHMLTAEPMNNYNNPIFKFILTLKITLLEKMIHKGAYGCSIQLIENHLLSRTDGVVNSGVPDKNDWITDSDLQIRAYWALHEIALFLKILI